MLEGIERESKKMGMKSETLLTTVTMVMLSSSIMGFLIDYICDLYSLWRLLQYSRLRILLFTFGSIFKINFNAFCWVLLYNLAVTFIKELETIKNLTEQISNKPCCQSLNSVLPVVEGHSSSMFCDVLSTHRCGPWYCRLQRFRKIMGTYCQMKNFHLNVSEVNFLPATLITLGNALGSSYLAVSFYYSEEVIKDVPLYRPNSLIHIIWVLASITPFIFNEWKNHRQENMAVRTTREVFSTTNLQTRQILSEFVFCANDQYPNDPWKVFRLDYSFLSQYADFALLLCTTFVVPQG
ncbi:hypothetical protein J6590_028739 [Homalodisca vitripennis]|nr:hypothetical protein J6590_028739 [Homalodisca vitripennis]